MLPIYLNELPGSKASGGKQTFPFQNQLGYLRALMLNNEAYIEIRLLQK